MSERWPWEGEPEDEADRRLVGLLRTLDRDRAPPSLPERAPPARTARPAPAYRWIVPALAAAALAAFVLLPREGWEIETLAGADACWRAPCRWSPETTLEAPEGTRWRVTTEEGELLVLPGAALRREPDHVRLERGALEVAVVAPPRTFRVWTPAAWVVDLGCAFRVAATETSTRLSVQDGSVALENAAGVSVVTAGSSAEVTVGGRPSLPLHDRTSAELRAAARAFDAGGPLAPVLEAAQPRDLYTLWHVLQLASPAERPAVLARIEALAGPVDQVALLRLDADALRDLFQAVTPRALATW